MKERDDRIVCDPTVCGGQPTFRGTRIPVHVVLDLLAAGEREEAILGEYPDLGPEHLRAALAYAATLAREEHRPLPLAG